MISKKSASIFSIALLSGAALGAFWASRQNDESHLTGAVIGWNQPQSAPMLEASSKSEARNLVLLIGDGMGFSHLTATRALTEGPGGRLTIERFPVTGWSATHSLRDLYTDSAAGATALATGVKTYPGAVSVDADGNSLETVIEAARDAGKAVGVITDSAFFDATPAAFLAHQESRRETLAVIEDMTSSRADLVIGETRARLEQNEAWPSLQAAIKGRDVSIVRSLAALDDSSGPVLGIFPDGSIADPEQSPSLDDLAVWAAQKLDAHEAGFVLLVETEETDTASHENDLERTVRGVDSLDSVAEKLVELLGPAGETLIVVTADHETGGLAVYDGGDGEPLRHRWATDGHTAEPVPVLAWGPGSSRFVGAHDNTELAGLFADALGVKCCGGSGSSSNSTGSSGDETPVSTTTDLSSDGTEPPGQPNQP